MNSSVTDAGSPGYGDGFRPFIGWKPCEGKFYLDALPIKVDEAIEHWKNKTANFGKNAARQVKLFIDCPNAARAMEWVNENNN